MKVSLQKNMPEREKNLLEKVVSLAKRRGFVYPGSEIYGGLANTWDYGPLGVELKNKLQNWWWWRFVRSREDIVGLDPAILMNPKIWQASGHTESFNDALVDCRQCQARLRADHLIEQVLPEEKVEGLPLSELTKLIKKQKISCPHCGQKDTFTEVRQFNLLFQTSIGVLSQQENTIYLRGELAQAMFVNFKNILDTTRLKLPFGIAAVGKVFRNEITPGNFIYRTLEFDLMEFEYFIYPPDIKTTKKNGSKQPQTWQEWFDYWLNEQRSWLKELGFRSQHLRLRPHTKDELAHYSKKTVDIEYLTPWGFKEIFGLAYRTDFDLKNHLEKSGADLRYHDPVTGQKFIPHVIEPTFGLSRLLLMVLFEFYWEEGEGKDKRIVLKLPQAIAPYQLAVFPLLANKPALVKLARKIFTDLKKQFTVAWDDRGNIGKRYYAQDEIGTPYCVTVDFDSLANQTVTVRDRDTAQQIRINIADLSNYFQKNLKLFF